MKHQLAFAGLRHGHIYSLYDRAAKDPACEITAVCEEDAAARKAARADITVTHESLSSMLANAPLQHGCHRGLLRQAGRHCH